MVLVLAAMPLVPALGEKAPADASAKTHPEPLPKPTSRMITLSDFGAEDLAFLAVPATPPTVGIVLVPDAYGLDNFTKAQAMSLASLGYIVVAVDIYNGHSTTAPGELTNMIANLNPDAIMKTISGGIRLFRESPKFHCDRVVTMGWGTGGTYVFQTAREHKDIDGAIMFYGPVLAPTDSIGKFAAPLCAVYPENDTSPTRESVVAFQKAMKASGNDFEAWFIAAKSGWSNPSSKNYNQAEDKEAWKVAVPFLMRIGAEPIKPKGGSVVDKTGEGLKKLQKSFENFFK